MRGLLGLIYAQLGAHEAGSQIAQASIDVAETLRPDLKGMGYAVLALCHTLRGEFDQAHASLTLARQFASWIDLSIMMTGVASADLGLAQGRYEQVLTESVEALTVIEQLGMRVFALPAQFYRGAALLGLGRLGEASDALAETVRASRSLGSRRVVWRALLTHAECETQRGHGTHAADLRTQAHDEVDLIASGLDSAELRKTFLRHARRSA